MGHAAYWITLAALYGLALFMLALALGETEKVAVLVGMAGAAVVLGKA